MRQAWLEPWRTLTVLPPTTLITPMDTVAVPHTLARMRRISSAPLCRFLSEITQRTTVRVSRHIRSPPPPPPPRAPPMPEWHGRRADPCAATCNIALPLQPRWFTNHEGDGVSVTLTGLTRSVKWMPVTVGLCH